MTGENLNKTYKAISLFSGGGGGENDHNIAKKAAENLGFTIKK